MVIMCQVHHLGTEKKEEKLQTVKAPHMKTNQANFIITGCQQIIKDFADVFAVANMHVNCMTGIEKKKKDKVEFLVVGHLVPREFKQRWRDLII